MALKTPNVKSGMRSSIAEAPDEITLFAAAAVPTSKTEVTNRLDLGLFDGCHLEIDLTLGNLTQVLVIPEFADTDADADYHQPTLRDAAADGTITVKPLQFKITASGKYHIPLKKQGRFLRVFLDGDTDATGSSLALIAAGAADIEEVADVSTDTVTVTPSGTQDVNLTKVNGTAHAATAPVHARLTDGTASYKALTDTELRATAVPISAASLPLPAGAATAANQQTNALTDAQLRATAVPVSGPLTDAQLRATPVPVSGTVTATPTGTQDVNQTQVNGVAVSVGSGVLGTGTQRVVLATDQPVVPVSDNAGSLTVDGTVTANAGTNLNTSALALEATLASIKDTAGVKKITDALPAGTNLLGKVGIDQTTPGMTDHVSPIAGQNGVQGASGVVTALTQRVVLATDVALPAGTNNIGGITGTGIMVGATPTAVASGTGDVEPAVAAAAGLRLVGFSVTEDAGTPGNAEVRILHGATVAGGVELFDVNVGPDENTREMFGPDGIAVASGITLDRVSGTTKVTLFHKTVA